MPLRAAISVLAVGVLAAGPARPGGDTHGHGPMAGAQREVPVGRPAPALTVKAFADPGDGFNLYLRTQHFTFSPERAGQATESAEGHAYLYVNGVKISRVYGPWIHLPDKLLTPGANDVRVTLNDNTQNAWAEHGRPVEATLTLEGVREVPVEAGGGVAPVVEIAQGERVRLVIHGAGAGEVHLHGYDLGVRTVAGEPATLTFRADHNGRFAVMGHSHDPLLGDREKALLYLDIRAR